MGGIVKQGQVRCGVQGLPKIEAVGQFDMLAYTAAFIDGDGSLSMTRDRLTPSVDVYNNNPGVLENILPVIGGKITPEHRGSYHLRVGKLLEVRKICELLVSKMVTKKAQAELIIKACQLPFGQQRREMQEQLSALNKSTHEKRPPDTVSLKIDTTTDASEWSYFGGYLDTDSTVSLRRQGRRAPYIEICCKKPGPLEHLRERFGGQLQSRFRDSNRWISSLEFEDEHHVLAILKTAHPFVLGKKEHIAIILEACQYEGVHRDPFIARLDAIDAPYKNLREFTRTADGKYVDSSRSTKKPHKTHKGKPLPPPSTPPEPEGGRSNQSLDNEEFQG